MINANDYRGKTDNETLENALEALNGDRILIIPPRRSDIEAERDYWLIDRAILLPADTTVILQNCKIKLSDRCRDNFFRSANAGMGINDPEEIRNIHIRGEGLCILEGADHPRATGDSSKLQHAPCPHLPEDVCRVSDWVPEERRSPEKLNFWDIHDHSYGTDAGKEGESQYGDWRGIGILFAKVQDFSIENLRIVKSHGWGISLEACAHGRISRIDFDACMYKEIDGMLMNMENQDGIDIRNGCHHIMISEITGQTGDDVIALTAIADDTFRPGGSVCNTHVMHNDWTKRDRDIHDIIIHNVMAHSYLCFLIRLLPGNSRIWNVTISNVIDTASTPLNHFGTLLLGEPDGAYGVNSPRDGMTNITISNVICNSSKAVVVSGYLKDSSITNLVNRNPDTPVFTVEREDGMENVALSGIVTAGAQNKSATD